MRYKNVNFYAGADYGTDPNYGKDFYLNLSPEYRFAPSEFGVPSDPRQVNQLKAVSDKLNTGAKTIEFSAITPQVFESMPNQLLKETHRLAKLTGVDLTFHGPIIEPTGISKQGWDDSQRAQAERQMWSSVERAHKLDPQGNIVVTFHSSALALDPETKVKEEIVDPKTGQKRVVEQLKEFLVADEIDGRFTSLSPKPDYFKEEKKFATAEEQARVMQETIEKRNKEIWVEQLQTASFHAHNGANIAEEVISKSPEESLEFYEDFLKGRVSKEVLKKAGPIREVVEKNLRSLNRAEIYLEQAYQNLQNMFNDAYSAALKNNSKSDLRKLDEFREEIKGKLGYIENPSKIKEFAETIERGINVLNSIKPPQRFKPFRDFAVDKSADTFSNIALNAYKKFKNTAPIISIENPPAGTGLSRAEDLRKLVEETREKLTTKLEKEGLSRGEAKKQAEKLIGVTWDVGHINMLRKYGYEDKDIVKQTKEIASLVKHVHLSDNFGMDHTELPMGMGNVPLKPMLEALSKYNKKLKKIIETGNWFGPQAFGSLTPFRETLRAFGSPIYQMKMAPYWNQGANASGGYFVGYGSRTLPEQHFASLYGSGFSNLPPELGGELGGKSRLGGGTPNE